MKLRIGGYVLLSSYHFLYDYTYVSIRLMEFCGSAVSVRNKKRRKKYQEIMSLKGYVDLFIS